MMKSFLLIVNILALTLPFLAADVQNQEQPACHENDERLSDQKTVSYVPIHYLNSYPHYNPNYYQPNPAVPINNLYIPHPYYAKPVVIKPQTQVPHRQVLPNIQQATMVRHPYLHPSFIAVLPKKIQHKTTTPAINTIAPVEPTPIPAIEPVLNTVVTAEASSEFIIESIPETASVPAISPVV
ncbi:PREDICTED: kappa-casein [Galeopterus variegatus]|uniref:Kappa-casein n=1 Tax=Galeopterus variegatus TaxID=482537 RepID=A0ABM0RHB7_GALVR|nr:PREDICTED: kappa-casein [Galeopterus variegatus]